MSASTAQPDLPNATRALVPYALAILGASAVMQLIIALTGNEIGLMTGLLTAIIAIGYVAFLVRYGNQLSRVRFGSLAAHVMTFCAVNVGFQLHFFALAIAGNPAVRATEGFAMDSGWFGVVVGMPTFWGLGLLLHSLGAILGRGFEASR